MYAMKTNTSLRPLGLALIALVAAGCTTPPPVVIDNGQGGPAAADPGTGTRISTPPPAYTVSEKTEMMKIAVAVSAADADSAGLAAGVRETAVTALRGKKFQVVADGAGDLSLSFDAKRTLYDETAGEYFTYDGTISARLEDSVTKNVLAEKTFRGRNKAALGKDKATADLSEALRPDIAGWIGKTVTPEQVPLEARTFRVEGIDRYKAGESAFIDDFVTALSAMKGVLRCETASRDGAKHDATFRVLYRRADYPQGFIHAAIRANPQFKLELK